MQIDSTGPGTVNVTATIKIATMVQADNGGNQDFVYLEFQTNSKTVTITFKNCKDLTGHARPPSRRSIVPSPGRS